VTEPLTAAGMTVAVILTMGLVSRPNGGGKSWAENKDDAVALVRAIEEEAARLVETSLAIDAALPATPTPDTRLREALTSWYAADGESWRLVAIDRDGGIVAAGIPEALLDAIIRRATREETT